VSPLHKLTKANHPGFCQTRSAWDEYIYWQGQDRRTLRRINNLIQDGLRDPFDGVGKPEPEAVRGSHGVLLDGRRGGCMVFWRGASSVRIGR